MKKISTLFNFAYLGVLMVCVVALLLFSLAYDSIVAFFSKKKSTHKVKNRVPKIKQKSSKYIIHKTRNIST